MLLTPPNMLLHPGPYAELPNQPFKPVLASLNPVNSEVKINQLAQPEEPEARVYGLKFEFWPYGLLPVEKMSEKVQVYCVYNSPL